MEIGLYNIDSKMPNIALMKLSQWHKRQGDNVSWYAPLWHSTFDKIYCSSVFTYSDKSYVKDDMICGGSGFDLTTELSPEVNGLMPDYTLYPDIDYSLGFTTRGCSRNCEFCIVREKEGIIRATDDIYKFWDRKHKNIILLDNNIFACGERFEEISAQLLKENLKVDFNQGLDIRLLTDKRAKILKSLRPLKQWRFAFDSIKYEDAFRKGAEMLLRNKISKSRICVYVLAGYNESIEDTIERINIIYNEYGFDPFVMLYKAIDSDKDAPDNSNRLRKWGRDFKDFKELKSICTLPAWKKYKQLARWVNRKAIFKSVQWEEYNLGAPNDR